LPNTGSLPAIHNLKSVIEDPTIRSALRELDRKLRKRFGSSYVNLILFGSRASGDNQPDSAADVAVILRGPFEKRWSVKQQIIEDTYPILLESAPPRGAGAA
jgi:predicted nucleotidyltransferase